MDEIKTIIQEILKRVPGIKGLILLDIDGIPVEIAGHFEIRAEDLGALLAACYNSYAQVGAELGQNLDMIIIEYGDLKLCQSGMPRGLLTVIASKESYLGLIRLEAKRAIEKISRLMQDTEDLRKSMMEQHKFRMPGDQDVELILAKLRKGLK